MQARHRGLKHRKEKLYGTLVLIVGAVLWAIVAATIALMIADGKGLVLLPAAIEIGILVLVLYVFKLFFRAHLYGHAVLLGERQFPRLYESLARGATQLGLDPVPEAFLYNSNGLVNAFAARIAGNRMVLLTSALIDVDDERQVDFVIGHELGHHAAGHLNPWMNLLKLPGAFMPLLGAAYHRARELTADRVGAFCVDDAKAARGALNMLACGSAKLNTAMNVDAFSLQEHLVPPMTGWLLHIFSGYPRLTRRVHEVDAYYRGRSDAPSPMADGRREPLLA